MSNSVRCAVRLVGGVAFSEVGCGLVTPDVLAALCAHTLVQLAGADPAVYVADFRRATWALTATDLDAMFDAASPELEAPAALVVAQRDVALFREHAWSVAQAGVLRKVFTDYPKAVAWAQARAGILSLARTAP